MAKRKPGPGRPRDDDAEALEWMRELRKRNPRIRYRSAALKWVDLHPPPPDGPQPASVARRLADKLHDEEGFLQRRFSETRLLLELEAALLAAWGIVRGINERRARERRGIPPGGSHPIEAQDEDATLEESEG